MFNVGGGELLVIFLVALIVLGPAKLPDVARQIGGVMREVRRISSGFQDEMRAAMDDPIETAARERGNQVVATSEAPAPATGLGDELADEDDPDHRDGDPGGADAIDDGAEAVSSDTTGDRSHPAAAAPMSTAAAAGMYDVTPTDPESTPNPYLAPVGTRAEPLDADGELPGGAEGESDAPVVETTDTAAVEAPDPAAVEAPDPADSTDRMTGER